MAYWFSIASIKSKKEQDVFLGDWLEDRYLSIGNRDKFNNRESD